MSSQSDDFWSGILIGSMLFGGKKHEENEKKESFLEKILGIAGLLVFILIWSSVSFFAAIFVFLGVSLGIGFIMGARKRHKEDVASAWNYFHNGEYSQALQECQPYWESDCDAAYIKGSCLLYGLGCDKNPETAFNYMKIAQKRNSEARAIYGDMLIHGVGCNQDLQEGRATLYSASYDGCPLAKLRIGEYMIQGINGYTQNYTEGMKNLRSAAEAGLPYAQYELGITLCSNIPGIQPNPELGLNYIRQAANAGVQEAIEYLNGHRY